jgi:protocatechuate 3,4-dioxygenase beta subunit
MKKIFISLFVVSLALAAPVAFGQSKGTLKGKVEDEKGKPIAGADVRIMSTRDRSIKETKTDASGNYSFEVDPGSYTVNFDAEGYTGGPHREMQQVESGKETKVSTIQLPKAKRTSLVRGAVFDSDGRSLGGVRVKLVRIRTEDDDKDSKKKFTSLSRDYVTNNRGEFAFRLPPIRARYRVTATLDGYKPETKEIDVDENEAVPLAFSLEVAKSK